MVQDLQSRRHLSSVTRGSTVSPDPTAGPPGRSPSKARGSCLTREGRGRGCPMSEASIRPPRGRGPIQLQPQSFPTPSQPP